MAFINLEANNASLEVTIFPKTYEESGSKLQIDEPLFMIIRTQVMDGVLKANAEKVFRGLGLTPSAAINLFYIQVARTNGIPFELKLDYPNQETIEAIKEADALAKNGEEGYKDMESLKKALFD